MKGARLLSLLAGFLLLQLGGDAAAHEIHLKNGRVIKTPVINRHGGMVTYEQFGGEVSIGLSEISQIKYDSPGAVHRPSSQMGQPVSGEALSGTDDLEALLRSALSPRTPIETANLAVVSIRTEAGYGSGFFVSEDGLIVTNRHVVRGSESNNRQVEEKIDDAEGRLAQWRRNLDQEKGRLDEYEKNLKKNWQAFLQAVRDQSRTIDPVQKKEVEASLKSKDSYVKQWRQDYENRRREFVEKSTEVNRHKKDFYQKNEQLARQSRFTVILADGSEKSALLYRVSDAYDLAILKLNGFTTPYLKPAKNNATALGQRVYAIGSPLELNNSVTSGVLSNYRGDYIQTNAEIYPGNSGGPLVTEEGLVLGVNTMKLITEKFEGLGFAIQYDKVRSEFADFLIRAE